MTWYDWDYVYKTEYWSYTNCEHGNGLLYDVLTRRKLWTMLIYVHGGGVAILEVPPTDLKDPGTRR